MIPFAWAPGWNSPKAWNKFQSEIGGALIQGDPGARLIEAAGTLGYRTPAPATDGSGLAIAPLAHIFGSEELSARAPVMASQVPAPYIALHPADAAALGLAEGQSARVQTGTVTRVTAKTVIEPATRRALAAPVNGYIGEAETARRRSNSARPAAGKIR